MTPYRFARWHKVYTHSMTRPSHIMDIGMLIFFLVAAAAITLLFHASLFVSTLLYFGVPVAYFSGRNPAHVPNTVLFCVLFSLPLSLFVDVLAALDGAWIVPHSLFPVSILGVATIEVYVYGLLWGMFAVLFYEHCFGKPQHREPMPRRMWYLIGLFVVLVSYAFIGTYASPRLLHIPYVYLMIGVMFVLFPLLLFLVYHPRHRQELFFIGICFFVWLFVFEITALYTQQWYFPGQHFIGFIEWRGLRFPLEELFFWMMLATPAYLSYYLYFAKAQRSGS